MVFCHCDLLEVGGTREGGPQMAIELVTPLEIIDTGICTYTFTLN